MTIGKRKRTPRLLTAIEEVLTAEDDALAQYREQLDPLFHRLSPLISRRNGAPPSPSTGSSNLDWSTSPRAASVASIESVRPDRVATIPSGPAGVFLLKLLQVCKNGQPYFANALEGAVSDHNSQIEDPRILILQRLNGTPEEYITGIDNCRKLLVDRSFAVEFEAWRAAQSNRRAGLPLFSLSRTSFTKPTLIQESTRRGTKFLEIEKSVGKLGISVLCCFHYPAFIRLSSGDRNCCASHLRLPS